MRNVATRVNWRGSCGRRRVLAAGRSECVPRHSHRRTQAPAALLSSLPRQASGSRGLTDSTRCVRAAAATDTAIAPYYYYLPPQWAYSSSLGDLWKMAAFARLLMFWSSSLQVYINWAVVLFFCVWDHGKQVLPNKSVPNVLLLYGVL